MDAVFSLIQSSLITRLPPCSQTVWPNRRLSLASGRAELLITGPQADVIAFLFSHRFTFVLISFPPHLLLICF